MFLHTCISASTEEGIGVEQGARVGARHWVVGVSGGSGAEKEMRPAVDTDPCWR